MTSTAHSVAHASGAGGWLSHWFRNWESVRSAHIELRRRAARAAESAALRRYAASVSNTDPELASDILAAVDRAEDSQWT